MDKVRILPSFLKGLRIMQIVASEPKGMKLADVARAIGLPASNATLYINTLASAGMVVRDPLSRKFFISPAAIKIFREAGQGVIHRLLPLAEKPMQHLHRALNENVLIAVRKDTAVVFVKYLTSSHMMGVKIEPEPDYPLHVTAAGRAHLAFLPEREIEVYLRRAKFKKLTSKTLTSAARVREALAEVRKNGFAFNPGEFEAEVMALAAPIMFQGRPIASLVVQFPVMRHDASSVLAAAPLLVKQAKLIEQHL
jgi:DNA-binding IclR family transcriptional regulator